MKWFARLLAFFLLVLVLIGPILIAGFWLFPAIAGLCVGAWLSALVKRGGSSRLVAFLWPIALFSLILFSIWLSFVYRGPQGLRPVEARGNRFVSASLKPTPPIMENTADKELNNARRRMLVAIEDERIGLGNIDSGRGLLRSSKHFEMRQKSSSTDQAQLIGANKSLEEAFRSGAGKDAGDLLDGNALEAYVKRVKQELDQIQASAESANATVTELNNSWLSLTQRLERYKISELSSAVELVENALRQIYKVDLGAANVMNTAVYDRKTDSLELRQTLDLNLGAHPCRSVDLSHLFEDTYSGIAPQIYLSQDDRESSAVSAASSLVPIEGARHIKIVRVITQPHASFRVTDGWVLLPVKAFAVGWPYPPTISLKLDVTDKDSPDYSWPYSFQVQSDFKASLDYIQVPPDSYFFSEDVLPPTPKVNKLNLGPSAPKLTDLVRTPAIRVELLPFDLPFGLGQLAQRYKEYLELPTVVGALIGALASAIAATIFTPGVKAERQPVSAQNR